MEASLACFRAGRLTEAVETLGAELRKQPASTTLRTFLFELLCFAGEFDRAEKQLDILAEQDAKVQLGAALYRNLLRAHRQREGSFAAGVNATDAKEDVRLVRINGDDYEGCSDEDPRIGCSLEVYAGSNYTRIPYRELEQIEIAAPRTLRDLLWLPATISLKGSPLSEENGSQVHIPALAPNSWQHRNDVIRLGRVSVVEESESGAIVPYGAKLLLCGNQEISLLDVRELAFVAG